MAAGIRGNLRRRSAIRPCIVYQKGDQRYCGQIEQCLAPEDPPRVVFKQQASDQRSKRITQIKAKINKRKTLLPVHRCGQIHHHCGKDRHAHLHKERATPNQINNAQAFTKKAGQKIAGIGKQHYRDIRPFTTEAVSQLATKRRAKYGGKSHQQQVRSNLRFVIMQPTAEKHSKKWEYKSTHCRDRPRNEQQIDLIRQAIILVNDPNAHCHTSREDRPAKDDGHPVSILALCDEKRKMILDIRSAINCHAMTKRDRNFSVLALWAKRQICGNRKKTKLERAG